jgi:hypothetical protein
MSTDNNTNNNNADDHLDTTYCHIKANGFFLMGSVLYLSTTIADVVTMPSGESQEQTWWYKVVLVGGMLSYPANGIFETIITRGYYKQQLQQQASNNVLQPLQADDIDVLMALQYYTVGDIKEVVGLLFKPSCV